MYTKQKVNATVAIVYRPNYMQCSCLDQYGLVVRCLLAGAGYEPLIGAPDYRVCSPTATAHMAMSEQLEETAVIVPFKARLPSGPDRGHVGRLGVS